MRAVSFSDFGGPEVLQVIDAPIPEPGTGQIRIAVAACGVNQYDVKLRRGLMGGQPPKRVGLEVAGRVDALGDGVSDVAIGDEVFGFSIDGGAADFTLSAHYSPKPISLDLVASAALPVAVETAYRVLDLVAVSSDSTVVINGASGGVGQSAVQIAVARGSRVIGTSSQVNSGLLESLGAAAVTYGSGLAERVRVLLGVEGRVDAGIDCAGGGALADLLELAGGPRRVVTIADFEGAEALDVPFSGGSSAFYGLDEVKGLIADGRFRLPVERTFALEDVGAAQEQLGAGHATGKIVLTL